MLLSQARAEAQPASREIGKILKLATWQTFILKLPTWKTFWTSICPIFFLLMLAITASRHTSIALPSFKWSTCHVVLFYHWTQDQGSYLFAQNVLGAHLGLICNNANKFVLNLCNEEPAFTFAASAAELQNVTDPADISVCNSDGRSRRPDPHPPCPIPCAPWARKWRKEKVKCQEIRERGGERERGRERQWEWQPVLVRPRGRKQSPLSSTQPAPRLSDFIFCCCCKSNTIENSSVMRQGTPTWTFCHEYKPVGRYPVLKEAFVKKAYERIHGPLIHIFESPLLHCQPWLPLWLVVNFLRVHIWSKRDQIFIRCRLNCLKTLPIVKKFAKEIYQGRQINPKLYWCQIYDILENCIRCINSHWVQ